MSNYHAYYPILIGLGATAIMYFIYHLLTGKWNPAYLFEGTDKRLSTSKFQWFLWLWVIVFAYITLYAARSLVLGHLAEATTGLPAGVLGALGISTATAAIAKGLTQSTVSQGGTKEEAEGTQVRKAQNLVADDSNNVDLSKMQIFVWTIIAVTIFLLSLWRVTASLTEANANATSLPDIDQTLLVLSGISAAGYLGTKIVAQKP